jgi:hypothetical protein
MSTDREILLELLRVVDAHAGWAVPESERALRRAANRTRRHLLLVENPDGDCAARVESASTAAYAAGEARGAGARPDRRHGHPGDGHPGTVTP